MNKTALGFVCLSLVIALAVSPALAVPVTVPGIRTPDVPDTPMQKALKAGYDALTNKAFDKAISAFKEGNRLDPKSADPLLGLAEVERVRGQAGAAEDWLKKALAVAPGNAQVHVALGRLKYATRKYSEAEAALLKAVSLDPKSVAPHLDLGELYINISGKPKEAGDAFARAAEIKPDHAGAHHGLGMAMAAQKKPKEAIAAFERAIALAPAMPLPYQALARTHAALGQRAAAIATLDRLLMVKSDYVPALLDRGDLQFGAKDFARAIDDYQRGVKHAPKSAPAHFKLGLAYQSTGKAREALQSYRASIAADAKYLPPRNNLAWLLAERKESLDEALTVIRAALELDRNVGVSYSTLGHVHRARGEAAAAIEAYRKAVAIEPKQAVFHYRLGVALAEKGEKKEALSAFNAALSRSASFPEAEDARRWVKKLGG